ncbi:MAG: TIGR04283 family arsenosugar biosynthesis glycosyltransferase [Spirochaetota bacterium]
MRRSYSIIVPVLNENEIIRDTIRSAFNQIDEHVDEIIVVDGDEDGSTVRMLSPDFPIQVILSGQGRARQMNAGAESARGEVLIFLHGDTRLPHDAQRQIDRALDDQHIVGGAFDLGFDDDHWWFALVAASGSLRSRLTRIPFGDQCQFFRKEYFHQIGGYPEIPIMEDVEIMRTIKQRGDHIKILDSRVRTSPRMWYEKGFLMNTLKNYAIQLMYLAGMPVETLASVYYRKHGGK